MKFVLLLLLSSVQTLLAQQTLLQSGPMLGYAEMTEVQLWLQTRKQAEVKFAYWIEGKEKHFTPPLKTKAENAYSAKILIAGLIPGQYYHYQAYINNYPLKFTYPTLFQTLPRYQQRFNAPDFSFAIGSCAHVNDSINVLPGEPFGGGYEIFESIRTKKPDFMVWLGDNVYLREIDWRSKTGFQYRYTHTRSLPQLQPLLASVHHYAIWDDHDYGPDDSDRSFWNKHSALETFNLFWCNPNSNLTNKGGITGRFQWNDVDFFLLDDRWFRSPNRRKQGERELLGKEQIDWLLDALSASFATFKFVCIGTPLINPSITRDSYTNFKEECDFLIKSLEDAKIEGLIFLSGDRHYTELSKLQLTNYPLYDLTVSPLLSRVNLYAPNNPRSEHNTRVNEKNFAMLKVMGKQENRKVVIEVYNTLGQQLWLKEINAKELK